MSSTPDAAEEGEELSTSSWQYRPDPGADDEDEDVFHVAGPGGRRRGRGRPPRLLAGRGVV